MCIVYPLSCVNLYYNLYIALYAQIILYTWVYIKCVYKINVLNVHCTAYIILIAYNYIHDVYMSNKPFTYFLILVCAH